MKFRNEAQRYWPRGQRLLAAVQWPADQRQLAPAGALLMTERELVLISEGKKSSAELSAVASSAEEPKETPSSPESPKVVNPTETPSGPGNVYEFAEIITFVPRVRLADFQVSHQESGVLTLQLRASQGEEKLEITFPSDHENAVSEGDGADVASPELREPNYKETLVPGCTPSSAMNRVRNTCMSRTDLLCLNRVIKPQIPLEEFLKFTADLGIKYVEVRNDFTNKGVLDGLSDVALQTCLQGDWG